MKSIIGIMLVLILTSAVPSGALADEALSVVDPWAPEAPPVAEVMAGYVTFQNNTDKPIVLVGASSPQFDTVEIHLSVERDGMARMVKQEELTILPGKPLSLSPGGYHLMLIGPKASLHAGDQIEVEFEARGGMRLPVNFSVKKPDAGADAHQHHHH